MNMSSIQEKPKIEKIEKYMLTNKDIVHIDCPTRHIFSPGVYVREITMPEGALVLGAKHTTTHLNILSTGACVLADVETGEITDLIAPCTFESKAGVQKLLYIVEECVWSTVHVTEETDVEVLESQLIELSPTYREVVGDKFIPGGIINEYGNISNGCSRNQYGLSNNGTESSS